MEQRQQERTVALKTKGSHSTNIFCRTKDRDVDLRKELEAKSRSKVVDVVALEQKQLMTDSAPEQHDFRHLLRHTEPRTNQIVSQPTVTHQSSQTKSTGRLTTEKMSTNPSQDYDYETQF